MRLLERLFRFGATPVLAVLLLAGPLCAAKDEAPTPKDYGVYVKTESKLVRILPNVVFDARIPYLESNNPRRFPLNEFGYFILYGKYDMRFLTLNSLTLAGQSPLGRPRFMFGKETDVEVKKRGEGLYTVKPKGLFGRGYYALWINDSAWDIVIE